MNWQPGLLVLMDVKAKFMFPLRMNLMSDLSDSISQGYWHQSNCVSDLGNWKCFESWHCSFEPAFRLIKSRNGSLFVWKISFAICVEVWCSKRPFWSVFILYAWEFYWHHCGLGEKCCIKELNRVFFQKDKVGWVVSLVSWPRLRLALCCHP